MTERSLYDFLVRRKEDGFSRDFWESDSAEGRKRIRKLEAEAMNEYAHGDGQQAAIDQAVAVEIRNVNKQLEELAYGLGQKFAKEREKLRAEIDGRVETAIAAERKSLRLAAAQIETEWKEMLVSLESKRLEIEALRRDLPPARRNGSGKTLS